MTDERFCPTCGADQPSGAFCQACGARLPEEARGVEALIGRVIDGRFRVLRLLGTGAMGAVYLAEHAGLGRRVAVKVLRTELRDQRDLVRRFRREITAVSRLTDAHTVTVFDSGMWKGMAYLVMEYLRGGDLAAALEAEGRLSHERAIRIACQIGSSLAEAHQQGIVHRDLKPENIFLTRTAGGDEWVKVLDFGLAKLQADDPGSETFQTLKGTLLGTPFYMAPEQIEGGEVGPATDLYALGALLYRMISGRHAFEGHTPIAVLEAHLKVVRPVLVEADLPPEVAALVTRLLARLPADRPASALEVVDLLSKFLPGERVPATRPAVAPVGPTPVRAPSSFSTSFTELPVVSVEEGVSAREASLPAATRDEFARYERRLARRFGWWTALAVLVAGGAAGVAWNLLRRRPPPTEELEPNDEPRRATPLMPDVVMRGYLGKRLQPEHSDLDFFALSGRGAALEAQVTGVPGIDLMLELFDGEGHRLLQANTAGEGAGEVLAGPVEATPVFLLVREVWVAGQTPSENSTDPYQVRIAWKSAP